MYSFCAVQCTHEMLCIAAIARKKLVLSFQIRAALVEGALDCERGIPP